MVAFPWLLKLLVGVGLVVLQTFLWVLFSLQTNNASLFYAPHPDSIYLVTCVFLSSPSLSPSPLSIQCPPFPMCSGGIVPSPLCEGPYMNLLDYTLYQSSSGDMYYRLVILCSRSKIHIRSSTYPVPLFCDCITSFRMVSSSSIHLPANFKIPLFFSSEQYSIVQIATSFLDPFFS